MSDNVDHATWKSKCESFLIDLLYEEKKTRLRLSTLDNKTWMKIENELAVEFRVHYTLPQLKAKWNRLRITIQDFDTLMQTTRFGWDPESNTSSATEDIWKNYLEKYPEGKKYKKKGLVKYDVLLEILGGTLATRKRALGLQTATNIGGAANFRGAGQKSIQDVKVEEETEDSDDILKTPPTKVKASERCSGRLKKKSANKILVEYVKQGSQAQATKSEAFIHAQEEFYHYIAKKRARLHTVNSYVDVEDSIPTCMGILNAIKGLDDRVYSLAVKDIALTKELRQAFINVLPKRCHAFLSTIFG